MGLLLGAFLGSPETSTPPAVPPEQRGGLTPCQPSRAARERWGGGFPEVKRGPSPWELPRGPRGCVVRALGVLWEPPRARGRPWGPAAPRDGAGSLGSGLALGRGALGPWPEAAAGGAAPGLQRCQHGGLLPVPPCSQPCVRLLGGSTRCTGTPRHRGAGTLLPAAPASPVLPVSLPFHACPRDRVVVPTAPLQPPTASP